MKLLLTSAGLRTEELAQSLARLVGKPLKEISIAVIDEASAVEEGDKRWKIAELSDLAHYVGGKIDFIDLLTLTLDEVRDRMASVDVIYVVGGNPDYLLYVFQKTGFDKLLGELLHEKVYIGSSAGSMVLTRRATGKQYLDIYAKTKTFGVEDYLGFVDIIFRPHIGSSDLPKYQFETLQEAASGLEYDVYALRDSQALTMQDGKLQFVGGPPHVIEITSVKNKESAT